MTIPADATIEIELSHFDTAAVNLDLQILDESLDEVASSASTDGFEAVEAPLAAGATYIIGVLPTDTPVPGTYILSIDVN